MHILPRRIVVLVLVVAWLDRGRSTDGTRDLVSTLIASVELRELPLRKCMSEASSFEVLSGILTALVGASSCNTVVGTLGTRKDYACSYSQDIDKLGCVLRMRGGVNVKQRLLKQAMKKKKKPLRKVSRHRRPKKTWISGFATRPQKRTKHIKGKGKATAVRWKRQGLIELIGSPNGTTVPPGQCAFSSEWTLAKLVDRMDVTHDTVLLTFQLPDESKPLGLSTCACILAKFIETGSDEPVVRPYTPVSTNAMVGSFQLIVKVYPGGKMSEYLNGLPIGSSVDFKHIEPNVKIQYPFGKKHITMLVGGTGITPMIQALHAILGNSEDQTQVLLIFGNRKQQDILCRDLLEHWSETSGGRLQVVHVLSDASDDDSWTGRRGFIDRGVLEEVCPPVSDNFVMVCGPPPMYNALCGPRDVPEISGVLGAMGYSADQVYKF